MMDIFVLVVGIVCFCAGLIPSLLIKCRNKYDGRMIVGPDDYFVAITTQPEELKKKSKIILKVISK
jgi:hypothetical protein